MNKRQLKKIALAVEAHYLLMGAETGAVFDRLSEEEWEKFQDIQKEMAKSWLRQAGFQENPGSIEEIFDKILNG